MADGVSIRTARAGDAAALADRWGEFGSEYVDLDPGQFQVPSPEGLVAWFASRLDEDKGDDALWLVAERNSRLVGFIEAQIWRPSEDADRQLMRESGETVLKVDSLMVSDVERRRGVGTSLMDAAEEWARARGATGAVVIASVRSSPAVEFYEARMGYERMTVGFRKSL